MPERVMKVFGNASKSWVKEFKDHSQEELSMNLMEYLRKKSVPVASSCAGEGICKKCIVVIKDNNREQEILSCLITLGQVFEDYNTPVTIKISYL